MVASLKVASLKVASLKVASLKVASLKVASLKVASLKVASLKVASLPEERGMEKVEESGKANTTPPRRSRTRSDPSGKEGFHGS